MNTRQKSPFPPSIAEIAVFSFEENNLPDALQERIQKNRVRIERQQNGARRISLQQWLLEYSSRKSI